MRVHMQVFVYMEPLSPDLESSNAPEAKKVKGMRTGKLRAMEALFKGEYAFCLHLLFKGECAFCLHLGGHTSCMLSGCQVCAD